MTPDGITLTSRTRRKATDHVAREPAGTLVGGSVRSEDAPAGDMITRR